MFVHMNLARKESYTHGGVEYEIAIYRVEEDGHLRGYVSSGGFNDRVLEMAGDVAYDMKTTTGADPLAVAVAALKDEIDAGKFDAGV